MKKILLLVLTLLIAAEVAYGVIRHSTPESAVTPTDNNQSGEVSDEIPLVDITVQTAQQKLTGTVEKEPEIGYYDPPAIVTTGDKEYFTTANGYSGYVQGEVTYIEGILVVNKTYTLPSTYGNGLTKQTQAAFADMKKAAAADGITLTIVSGFRSYDFQVNLYNKYVRNEGKATADGHSARPGHSEHQAGLAMDLNRLTQSFDQSKEFAWLQENAYKYGFILRYPKGKTDQTGYIYEPWHYRYVGTDFAAKLYNDGDWLTVEEYFGITSQYAEE